MTHETISTQNTNRIRRLKKPMAFEALARASPW
jgi:hypothetical protein